MEVTYFSDHGYYGDWGEWEGQWKNDETYKVTRERKCLSKWSPKHDGVTCDPSESSEVSKTFTLEKGCATDLEFSPDLTKYYRTFTSPCSNNDASNETGNNNNAAGNGNNPGAGNGNDNAEKLSRYRKRLSA